MKIYNKKQFYFSCLWLVMGISIIVLALVEGDLNFNSIFGAVCGGILGINGLGRSLSQKRSQENKVEELDERNRLIELKSKRKAFQIMQFTLLSIGLFFTILSGVYKDMVLGVVGIVGMGMWTFSLVLDWLTFAYYETKN